MLFRSATQTNRTGFSSSDVELTDTSESFGLPATADFMFALINSEELEKMSQLMVKQLKNRYNDVSLSKKFFVGVDRSKMKLYTVSDSSANNSNSVLLNEQEKNNTNKFNKFKSFRY